MILCEDNQSPLEQSSPTSVFDGILGGGGGIRMGNVN